VTTFLALQNSPTFPDSVALPFSVFCHAYKQWCSPISEVSACRGILEGLKVMSMCYLLAQVNAKMQYIQYMHRTSWLKTRHLTRNRKHCEVATTLAWRQHNVHVWSKYHCMLMAYLLC